MKGLLLTMTFLLTLTPSLRAQDLSPQWRVRYLFSIDVQDLGEPVGGISSLYLDRERGELYILDDSRRQVVITDTEGRFLYAFTYRHITGNPVVDIATDPSGNIYLVESKRILVFNYRGEFKGEFPLSLEEGVSIQSLAIDREGRFYIGIGSDVLVTDRKGRSLFHLERTIPFTNTLSIDSDEEGMAFLDPALFSVFLFDTRGRFVGRFGRVSSLAGGFSMPSGLSLDRRNRRIIVVDTNRWMVIGFDRQGRYLFEFGGPRIFRWPRAVVTDGRGRIYVTDGTLKVRVFEVVRE